MNEESSRRVSDQASLSRHVVSSALSMAWSTLAGRLISILQIAIVARLLTPEDFGVFALLLVVVTGAEMLTSMGVERVLIQRPTLSDGFIGSAWMLNIARGIIIALICVLLSLIYPELTHEPRLESLLLISALIPLFAAMSTPDVYLAERNFSFARLAKFEVGIGLFQLVVAVSMAYYLRDIYALVWTQVLVALIRAVASWVFFGVSHLPRVNLQDFKELIQIGGHYLVLAIGTFIMTQVDNLMVGSMLGATLLGYYVLAYQISQWPVDIMSKIVGRLALPTFSHLQHDPERLDYALHRVFLIQFGVLVPFAMAIYLFAEHIVLLVLGSEYQTSIALVQALILVVVGRGLSHVLVPFIIGTGHVQFLSRIKVIEVSAFVGFVWMGIAVWGLLGAAFGAGIAYLLASVIRLAFLVRLSSYGWLSFGAIILPSILSSSISTFAVAWFYTMVEWTLWLEFFVGGLIFVVIYLLCAYKLQGQLISELRVALAANKEGA